MDFANLTVERRGRIAVVRLNRPEARNAMSVELLRDLRRAADVLREDMALAAVVLTGGDRFFTAGVDLKDPAFARIAQEPLAVRRRLLELGPNLCAAWEALPQITIAAIEGYCVGGGVSLAVSCDFRVLGQNAFLRIPEIDLGMNYSWTTLPRLANLVGPANAKKWVIFAEEIGCEEALGAGFAQWAAPAGKTADFAMQLALKISQKPQAPVFMTKRTVNACFAANHAVAQMDADQFALTLTSEDFQEGVRAFLEKRKPVFNKNLPLD